MATRTNYGQTAVAFILASLFSISSQATPIELIQNGEFEVPVIGNLGFPASPIPGWTCSSGACELFGQGFAGSPVVGSDGFATGQHHEVTNAAVSEFTTQGTGGLSRNGTVDLVFDSWARAASGIRYSLFGTLSGALINNSYLFNTTNTWEAVSVTGVAVQAGESLTLRFESIGGSSAGAHIDQVSLQYTVPIPSTLAILFIGLLGLVINRRTRG